MCVLSPCIEGASFGSRALALAGGTAPRNCGRPRALRGTGIPGYPAETLRTLKPVGSPQFPLRQQEFNNEKEIRKRTAVSPHPRCPRCRRPQPLGGAVRKEKRREGRRRGAGAASGAIGGERRALLPALLPALFPHRRRLCSAPSLPQGIPVCAQTGRAERMPPCRREARHR